MTFSHIQDGTVKKYLLGKLAVEEATVVEELYFTNRSFFKEMRKLEIELICNYLDGALGRDERTHFERRYLHIPALRQLLEKVREQRVVAATPAPAVSRWAMAAVVALACVIVISLWISARRHRAVLSRTEPPSPVVTLFLQPGLTKGTGSQAAQLVLSNSVQPVSLIAELPGQPSPGDYVAKLFKIENDGTQTNIFSSGTIRSAPRIGGQQVTVALSSSAALSPGDYILELAQPSGPVQQTYVFRVVSSAK